MGYLEPLMRQNFLEYASYVIIDRAIPDLRDGCKPVQRRLLATLFAMDDGRYHKVANVIGDTMKLHPHGDASIGDALVVLANKEYFIDKQGNFGNILTGHPAAAARYIECRLTPLAKDTLFSNKLTAHRPSYDGRHEEPIFLPAKLPVILLLGIEGIAVGMSTRILPHNFCELLEAQIALLRREDIALFPDFPQGGLMDALEYDDGRGKVRVRARLETSRDRKTMTIREVPYSTTTESLINSIEAAAQKGKLKVTSIEDRTAEQVEIVLHLSRGVYADEVEPQLYAYTQCEVAINSSLIVITDERPLQLTVTEVLKNTTDRLREQIRRELELEARELEDRRHYLTLEQIFIENRVYQRIEEARTAAAVRREVREGMEEYRRLFVRDLDDDDIERLLQIRIRRISLFDIEKNRKDIGDIVRALRTTRGKLRRLTQTTVEFITGLLEKYGAKYPRRTEIVAFEQVSKQEVARQSLKVSYDPDSGFLGSDVRGSKHKLTVSEYDKLLVVSADGTYRIVGPPEKLFVGKKVRFIEPFDKEAGAVLSYLYRDPDKNAWAKKIHIQGFIHDKVYELVKGSKGRILNLWLGDPPFSRVHLQFVPKTRQRVNEGWFELAGLEVCGLAARGTRMATKAVEKIRLER